MTDVKFCGLTRAQDAQLAESHGATFVGVILAGGPRLVDLSQARQILGDRREGVQRVAVFGDEPMDRLLATADTLDLDVVQLHGDPTPAFIEALRARSVRALWPVLRVDGGTLHESALGLAEAAGALVLDAKVVGQLGGTGVSLDWHALAGAVQQLRAAVPVFRLILAGGLRPDNVGRAIALLQPDVVDVSSGVESAPGLKDPVAVARFVSAVHAAQRNT